MAVPNIYIFNPTGEMAIANGTISYQAPLILQEFESALSSLPAFFANSEDILLCHENTLSEAFVNLWQDIGIEMPQSKILTEALKDNEFLTQQKNELHPWCWSPAMHHTLRSLKQNCSTEFLSHPNTYWNPEFKALYSRKTALDILSQIVEYNNLPQVVSEQHLPKVCSTMHEIETILFQHGKIVLKAPWSSSGRGLQVLRNGKLNDAVKQWSSGILKQQGYIMVEPLFNKKIDLAFQFSIKKGNPIFLGTSYFSTNTNGLYQENLIGRLPELSSSLRTFLFHQLDTIPEILTSNLKNSIISQQYDGYLGVDAIIYEHNGHLKIQPCLEINLRYNMGTLALQLEKLIHPNAKGSFKVYFNPKQSFDRFVKKMSQNQPTKTLNNKAIQGFHPISSNQKLRFGAYLELI